VKVDTYAIVLIFKVVLKVINKYQYR